MSKQSQLWRISLSAVLFIGMSGFVPRAFAETDLKFGDVVKEVKIGGDMRLRYDDKFYRNNSAAAKSDTPVFRTRLRLGVDFTLPSNFSVHTRFATGTGQQVSTNQTFNGGATEKQFWLDRAYAEWAPMSSVKLLGGKMANPLWTLYTSDAWVDPDINPEGAGENFSQLLGTTKVFLNALQSPITQKSGITPHDVYLFSEQVGFETKLPMDSRLKAGYAYHDWYNLNRAPATSVTGTVPTDPVAQEGNRRFAGGGLVSAYYVNELSAELSSWVGKFPLSIQGTFLRNGGAADTTDGLTAGVGKSRKDTGYQLGGIFGKAQAANSWELAYFYKYLEADCTPSMWADSDFGDGGTNRKGHIMWVAYNPTTWLTLQTKYFVTKRIDKNVIDNATFTGNIGNGDMNRVQVDAVVKF